MEVPIQKKLDRCFFYTKIVLRETRLRGIQ